MTVFATSSKSVCALSRLPDKKIIDPRCACKNSEHTPFLFSLVSKGDFDVLFPIGEMATNKITENEEEF